jgi:hypothetical protein
MATASQLYVYRRLLIGGAQVQRIGGDRRLMERVHLDIGGDYPSLLGPGGGKFSCGRRQEDRKYANARGGRQPAPGPTVKLRVSRTLQDILRSLFHCLKQKQKGGTYPSIRFYSVYNNSKVFQQKCDVHTK